jgi:hypothetical protein
MVDTLEEFILQELRERNCRSVHYWGDGSPALISALIGVKLRRISCSVSKGSSDDLIRVGCVPTIRFLKEGLRKVSMSRANLLGSSESFENSAHVSKVYVLAHSLGNIL